MLLKNQPKLFKEQILIILLKVLNFFVSNTWAMTISVLLEKNPRREVLFWPHILLNIQMECFVIQFSQPKYLIKVVVGIRMFWMDFSKKKKKKLSSCHVDLKLKSKTDIFLVYQEELKKAFVLKLLLSEVRKCGKIVMIVVISCVTASLIPGSKTAHSDSSLCWTLAIITQQPLDTEAADVIKQVIICDKCTVFQSCFWGKYQGNKGSFWWRNCSLTGGFSSENFSV